jgi:hypothetical protein
MSSDVVTVVVVPSGAVTVVVVVPSVAVPVVVAETPIDNAAMSAAADSNAVSMIVSS